MGFRVHDALLVVTKALPAEAAAVSTDPFDLGHGSRGELLCDTEMLIEAPALETAELDDDDTMTYIVEHDDDDAFGTAETLLDNVIVQTGADAAGAGAASRQVRFPTNVKRYVRVTATSSGAGDASGKSVVARLVF